MVERAFFGKGALLCGSEELVCGSEEADIGPFIGAATTLSTA